MAGDTKQLVLNTASAHMKHGVTPMFAYTAAELHGEVR